MFGPVRRVDGLPGACCDPVGLSLGFAVPGQPAGVRAVLQAPDTALVTWLPPTHPNGQLTKYSVYVRDLEGGRQVRAAEGS